MGFDKDFFNSYDIGDDIINNIELSLSDLYNFYKRFVASNYNPKCEAPHIKELSQVLESMAHGDFYRLCVAMAPRHSKSSLITLAYPFWLILHNPNLKILIVNAEASLSEKFGIRLRELFKKYGAWFGVYLSDVKKANNHIMFSDANNNLFNGFIRLTGASGSITGQDADYLILDDVYKGFEDITPSLLAKKIEWFKTIILQRIEPQTRLIILNTRWSNDDLIGYLKSNNFNDYKFIEYPAIKQDGSPLWSQRYSIDFLNQQKQDMGERLFKSIFQQMPMDETGDYFNINNIIWDDEPFNLQNTHHVLTLRSWDCAYSDNSQGDKHDYSAGVLMTMIDANNYVVHDIQHGQYGDLLKHKILEIAKNDGFNIRVLIETGTSGGASEFLFKEYQKFLGQNGIYSIQSKPIGSKIDRAFPLQQAILDNKIRISIQDKEVKGLLIQQLKGFPSSKHDDIIDSMAYAFNELSKYSNGSLIATSPRVYKHSKLGRGIDNTITRSHNSIDRSINRRRRFRF